MSAAYNVFVSWSGTRSKAMGEAFRDWLPHVIQSAVPFFSDKDIASGALWDEALQSSLQAVKFAVVCCTVENVTAPWLNYEAGALVERMKGGTAPWLLDGKPEELQASPIARLQAKAADPVGTLAMLQALNESLPSKLAPNILESAFQTHWPKLEGKLKAIPVAEATVPQRDQRDMLEEIVNLTRQIVNDMPTKPTLEGLARKQVAAEAFLSSLAGTKHSVNVLPITPPAAWGPVRARAVELVQQHAIGATGHPLPYDEIESLMRTIRRKYRDSSPGDNNLEQFIEGEFLAYLATRR